METHAYHFFNQPTEITVAATGWLSGAETTAFQFCSATNQIRFFEIEGECGRQCRQAVQTSLCGGIPADLTFLLLFWSSKKVEEVRGFTGHEHYPYFQIINMNGRLYDPVIARFFSPDKYVANSTFTQDFNRYSYARNNPLHYVDPSGEFVVESVVIGAFIGAMINLFVNRDHIDKGWQMFAYAGIGAAAGAASGAAGGAAFAAVGVSGFLGGMASGAAGGAASNFITGAGNAWMQGANFGQGLFAGLKSGVIGGVIGGISGGLIGGITAAAHGANFWDGSFAQNFAVPGASSDISYEQALKEAGILNDPNNAWTNGNDGYLAHTANNEFAYKAGMLDNGTLTTRAPVGTPGGDYGYIPSNGYYLKADGTISGGSFVGKLGIPSTYQLHISPGVLHGDITQFRAIFGHELIHAFHAAAFGLNRVEAWSEAAAYRYSYNVYMNAGIYKPNIPLGYFPRTYLTPLHLFW